ncbi:NADH-quinone oxidoreductase subunit M [Pirellula sp. SH-Sr6A]|uniref:proton-conducting transporter transmembrane domain-containing protein n=1 Tax=Pirellula sp. SH-Sr6A TaxID=1632865 RepID=UPI00078BE235|nr:proton-conducting transporter membrane subunit [Pirellula sp. SH-Sr6A]AMV35761.1 NADH-quinone oxidoreductase subunit M [Pirellula sp. SH-Sr6A]
MNGLHFPFLETTLLVPLVGCLFLLGKQPRESIRRKSLWIAGLTLVFAIATWWDFATLHVFEAHDEWSFVRWLLGKELLIVDEFSAPLLPLTALIFLFTLTATVGHKVSTFSYQGAILSEAISLAVLSTKDPVWVVVLLVVLGFPVFSELANRKQTTRVFALHHLLFAVSALAGCLLTLSNNSTWMAVGLGCLTVSIGLRCGLFPFSVWIRDLMQRCSFGSSLLYLLPMLGPYAAARLLLPVAPEWIFALIEWWAMATAIFAAGMALVQVDARAFFGYLLLSHVSLVMVGLDVATPIALTGALSLWLSAGIAMSGYGIVLRCVEARIGRLRLDRYYGLYEHMPTFAWFYLLSGLASVGFPCTIGFIASELLIEGAVDATPVLGMGVVLTMALQGIAIMSSYFRIFTGARHISSVSLSVLPEERIAMIFLTLLILGAGVIPQIGVGTRYRAAVDLRNSLRLPEKSIGEEDNDPGTSHTPESPHP